MASVMILNGENRGVLGMTRSFGKRGFTVYIGSNRGLARTAYSKYCCKSFQYSPIHADENRMHRAILEHVRRFRPDVLFPFLSDTGYVVLKHLDEYMKHTRVIPMPGFDRFVQFNDKERQIKELEGIGCSIPETYFPKDRRQVKKISKELVYPVLIKPRISSGARGIIMAGSPEELLEKYKESEPGSDLSPVFDTAMPFIQEFVEGDLFNCYVLFREGKHVASMVNNYVRMYPPTVGGQTANVTLEDERVRSAALGMFEKLGWHGPANALFIVDKKDRLPKIIEINPRCWATMESSIAAGIDFPFMMYQMAMGKKITPVESYRLNQEFRWLLFSELLYLLRTDDKLRTMREYFRFSGAGTEVDFRDIKPHMVHLLEFVMNRQVL